MLGLTAAAMASAVGAATVVVTDINSQRLERALQFGADHTVLVDDQTDTLTEVVQSVTEGRGIDVAVDVCGVAAAVQAGLNALRIGGIQVLLGSVFPGPPCRGGPGGAAPPGSEEASPGPPWRYKGR